MLSLPLTYTLFSHWLDDAAVAVTGEAHRRSNAPEVRRIAQVGQRALGGQAERRGNQWKWRFRSDTRSIQFDLDMASSGQRANWSLPYIAQALFMLRARGDVAHQITLFVEEPEIHLHPAAQAEMVKVLALLARHGFRVVMTTHSLTVIYALNNLMQAAQLGDQVMEKDLPEPDTRLAAHDVAVYAFTGNQPRSLVDEETGFIDERELGEVGEHLAASLNRIGFLAASREGT